MVIWGKPCHGKCITLNVIRYPGYLPVSELIGVIFWLRWRWWGRVQAVAQSSTTWCPRGQKVSSTRSLLNRNGQISTFDQNRLQRKGVLKFISLPAHRKQWYDCWKWESWIRLFFTSDQWPIRWLPRVVPISVPACTASQHPKPPGSKALKR